MLKEHVMYRYNSPINIDFLSVEEYPIHHHDAFEIIFVLEGTLIVKDGFFVSTIKKGDLWFVDSNDLHSFSKIQHENRLLVLHMDLDYYIKFFPNIKNTFFASITEETNDFIEEAYKEAQSQVLKIALHLLENEKASLKKAEDLSIQLLHNLIQNFQNFALIDGKFVNDVEQKDKQIMSARVQKVIQFIYNNYDRKLTLKEIADAQHLSIYYLSHVIKETTKMSFQDLLNLIRVENSEKLLLGTNKKIAEIARDCGFSASRYYENSFVKWYFMPPENYRRINMPKAGSKAEYRNVADCGAGELYRYVSAFLHQEGIRLSPLKEEDVSIIEISVTEGEAPDRPPFFDEIQISDLASPIWETTYGKFQKIKNDFKLKKILIDSSCLSSDPNSITSYITAKNINYLLKEGIRPIFTVQNISGDALHILEGFLAFYTRKLNGGASEIAYRIYRDSRVTEENCAAWVDKLTKRIGRITGAEPGIDVQINKSVSLIFTDCLYDSFVLAPFAVDNILNKKNWPSKMESIAFDPVGGDGNIFSGGCGIMTWNGIRKPWFFSCLFLSKIRGSVLSQGPGHIAVQNKNQTCFITYNMEGYSPVFLKSIRNKEELCEMMDSTSLNKTHVFRISGIYGEYKLIRETIDQDCCLFTRWRDLGYCEFITDEEENMLERVCRPDITMKRISCDGTYELFSKNRHFGVEFITLEKI